MDSPLFIMGAAMMAGCLGLLHCSSPNLVLIFIRRVGLLALLALICSVAQMVGHSRDFAEVSRVDQAIVAVQGLPVNAGGWFSQAMFGRFFSSANQVSAYVAPDQLPTFLAVIAGQTAILAVLLTARANRKEEGIDGLTILILGAAVINSLAVVGTPWWW